MADEQNTDDAGIKNGFKPTGELWGRFKSKVVVASKVPEIAGEAVTASIGRHIVNWWLSVNGTVKMLYIIGVVGAYYVLRTYITPLALGFLIGIIAGTYILGHFISEWHLQAHLVRIRKAKVEDDVKIVNVESKGMKVNLQVLKAKLGPGEDAWEEYVTVDQALDPRNPNALRRLGVTPMHTSWGDYIFAKEVDLQNRLLIGEKDDYPAVGLLPYISDSSTYIPEASKWIEDLWKHGKITPEQLKTLESEGTKVFDALDSYINKLADAGAKVVNLKKIDKDDRKLILGLNRISSRFFQQYKEYKDFYDLPLQLRTSRIMNAINVSKESNALFGYWFENQARMEQESMGNALGVLQNELGITSEGVGARLHETIDEFATLRSLKEKEIARRYTGEESTQ